MHTHFSVELTFLTTRPTGEIYEEKQRHCSNFLHWSPFEMAPENETWTLNLFPRERGDIRQYACDQDNGRCIEHEALFLLVGECRVLSSAVADTKSPKMCGW